VKKEPPPARRSWLALVGVMLLVFLLARLALGAAAPDSWTYTEFTAQVAAGTVAAVSIDDTGGVRGTRTDKTAFTTRLPVALAPLAVEEELRAKGVTITATASQGSWLVGLLAWLP
jgi:cell division protease FtsH